MQRPSEQLRRILEELGATRVEPNQKSINHLKLAHSNLSRFWAAVLTAEKDAPTSGSIGAQEGVRLTIWNRHVRLCSLLNEFFRNGSASTFTPRYATPIGAYIFTATREVHPGTDTHTVYTFALTSAKATSELPQSSTNFPSSSHSS